VRCSPDGGQIAFRMRDKQGRWQIFLLPPTGGTPVQATFVEGGVDTGARWHPSGHAVVCVAGTRIVATVVQKGERFGQSIALGDRAPAPYALVWSHDGRTIAYNRVVALDTPRGSAAGERERVLGASRVTSVGKDVSQIFAIDYPDRDGDGLPDLQEGGR
jgi:dipeptidyl aminopeptidase/acylaminoacyl peptidase